MPSGMASRINATRQSRRSSKRWRASGSMARTKRSPSGATQRTATNGETMTETPTYAVYAVRYAHRDGSRGDAFYPHDPHDGPMPMDYFVWAAVSPEHTVIVDAGFT